MKLLHVIHSIDPAGGGPVEVIKQLGRVHREEGHRVEVVSLDGSASCGVRDFPLPLHTMRTGCPREGDYGFAPTLIPWLRRALPEFDAVITHGLWQFHNLGVWRAARAAATPYFVFPHGMFDPWFRRRHPLKHVKKWLYWKAIESRFCRDAHGILFASDEERRLAHVGFTFDTERDQTVNLGAAEPPNNADGSRRAFYEKYPQLEGKRLLLFLGRLHEKKGCELLIEAFAARGSDLHLLIAGPCADASYLRKLHALAGRRCDPSTITFCGRLSGDLKWAALQAADVFILPSHQENFGVAVAEALACGTPVLLSNQVNIWREVEGCGAGMIASDDLAGTSRLIECWANLPREKREAMRVAARGCFAKHFNIRNTAAQMLEIIRAASRDAS